MTAAWNPALPDTQLLERDLTTQAIGTRTHPGLARQLGWHCYHTLRSKGSEPGYPDWTLVRDRVIFLELKTEKGRLSAAQRHWIQLLLDARAEAYIVRPSDLHALASVLSARHRVISGLAQRTRHELT